MSLADLLSFIVVATLLVMSPGPNGVLVAKTVPTSGRGAGFANVAGFVAAFYLHGALSIFGISLILVQSAQLFLIVKLVGAGYLCWIGAKALHAAWKGETTLASTPPAKRKRHLKTAFAEGFLTNALNPKVSMFYLAAFPQFIPHAAGGETAIGTAFTLVVAHSLINAVWFGVMVLLFARLASAARHPGFQRWLKGVTGAVFIGFGAKLAMMRAA